MCSNPSVYVPSSRPPGSRLVVPETGPCGHVWKFRGAVRVSFLPCWCADNDLHGHHIYCCIECGARLHDPPHDDGVRPAGSAYTADG